MGVGFDLVFLVGLVGVPIMLYRVVVRYRDNEVGGSNTLYAGGGVYVVELYFCSYSGYCGLFCGYVVAF